jgi:hypothetical protein
VSDGRWIVDDPRWTVSGKMKRLFHQATRFLIIEDPGPESAVP